MEFRRWFRKVSFLAVMFCNVEYFAISNNRPTMASRSTRSSSRLKTVPFEITIDFTKGVRYAAAVLCPQKVDGLIVRFTVLQRLVQIASKHTKGDSKMS